MITTYHQLRACPDVGSLFARAAAQAKVAAAGDRALVASISDGLVTAQDSDPLADAGSDALRLALLQEPVPVAPATALADRLGLHHHLLAPVAPDDRPLALLVVDRRDRALGPDEVAAVEALATVLAITLERLVLRRRAEDLADEVRRFADLAKLLSRDVVDAPVALPSDHGLGSALPRVTALVSDDPRFERFSAREKRIVGLLAEGRTNREIAALLVLSPETVKTHVTRLLRKLGAANRSEAVAMLLRGPDQHD